MIKSRIVAALLAVAAVPVMTMGAAGSAHADGNVSWKNGTDGLYLFSQQNGGSVAVAPGAWQWHDVQNSDGSWNEVDRFGHCLTGYGSQAYTENCNSGRDGTNSYERWREVWVGSGKGFKLQNVQSGGFLDNSGNGGFGAVYVNGTDYNNQNQRWY